jgi:hypothetical protein
LLVAFGSTLLALLAIAAWMRPDERGFGTHERLGFPPCTFQYLFETRCPSCGMTTAWSHFVRGRLDRAFQSNVGGALLAGLALVVGPWTVASGVRGRWVVAAPNDRVTVGVSLAIVFVTLIDWASRYLLTHWS